VPPLALAAPPPELSNRLFLLGLPQAAAAIKAKPAHQARTPPVDPACIATESNIEKELCSGLECASTSSTGWLVPLTTTRA
jgi:hypothetical protein